MNFSIPWRVPWCSGRTPRRPRAIASNFVARISVSPTDRQEALVFDASLPTLPFRMAAPVRSIPNEWEISLRIEPSCSPQWEQFPTRWQYPTKLRCDCPGGEGRQGCPQGQSGGPFRVPICLAREGDLSPLSTAFHAAAGLAHATRNVARGIARFGDGVELPQGSWPATGGDQERLWTRRAERRERDGQH